MKQTIRHWHENRFPRLGQHRWKLILSCGHDLMRHRFPYTIMERDGRISCPSCPKRGGR